MYKTVQLPKGFSCLVIKHTSEFFYWCTKQRVPLFREPNSLFIVQRPIVFDKLYTRRRIYFYRGVFI